MISWSLFQCQGGVHKNRATKRYSFACSSASRCDCFQIRTSWRYVNSSAVGSPRFTSAPNTSQSGKNACILLEASDNKAISVRLGCLAVLLQLMSTAVGVCIGAPKSRATRSYVGVAGPPHWISPPNNVGTPNRASAFNKATSSFAPVCWFGYVKLLIHVWMSAPLSSVFGWRYISPSNESNWFVACWRAVILSLLRLSR